VSRPRFEAIISRISRKCADNSTETFNDKRLDVILTGNTKSTPFEIRSTALHSEIACVPLRAQVKYIRVPQPRVVRRQLLGLVVIDY
jgi:hypothetical protein